MKQLPKSYENLSVFEKNKLELSEMYFLRGGGDDGTGGGQGSDEDPPPPPPFP